MTRWQIRCGWEGVALFVICMSDMLSTLYWVHTHQATEANPWMAHWLANGDFAFCAVKMMSFLPLIAVAAYYRPRRPRLIAISMRGTLVLYILTYSLAVVPQIMQG